jgi:hypothetical protein
MSDEFDFELRLGAAVKMFAKDADIAFDATQVASSALGSASEGWLIRSLKRPTLGWRALAAAIAVVAFVAAVGIFFVNRPGLVGVQPTPSPVPSPSASPTPSPTPQFSRFTSSFHDISIEYPSGWQTKPATEPWDGGWITFESPGVDIMYDPAFGEDLYLVVVSEPLGGTSSGRWVAAHDVKASLIGVCYFGGGGGAGNGFQDNPAWPAWFQHCQSTQVVFFATPTRGYVIAAHDRRSFFDASLGEDGFPSWFDARLASVQIVDPGQ